MCAKYLVHVYVYRARSKHFKSLLCLIFLVFFFYFHFVCLFPFCQQIRFRFAEKRKQKEVVSMLWSLTWSIKIINNSINFYQVALIYLYLIYILVLYYYLILCYLILTICWNIHIISVEWYLFENCNSVILW